MTHGEGHAGGSLAADGGLYSGSGTTGSENEDPGALKPDSGCPGHGQEAVVIGIVPRQAAVGATQDHVDGTGKAGRRSQLIQILDNRLLVRNGHIDSAERLVPEKFAQFLRTQFLQFIRFPGKILVDYA